MSWISEKIKYVNYSEIPKRRIMADDRADPIMDNYDPDGEAHMFGIINGDILYVPTGEEEDDISSYLNLDGEDEGRRQQDDAEQTSINDDLQMEVATTSGAEVYIYTLSLWWYKLTDLNKYVCTNARDSFLF